MDTDDPLAGVAVFVAAARARTFTEAAERLGLSKSAIGKSVARLEHKLGFKLFHRSTRVTRLTADGEAYLAACAKAIDEIKSAQDALSSSRRILSGRLHIDMPVAFGRRVLLPLLVEIVRPHPQLSLTLAFTDATSDLLKEDVDIAIRFGELKDSSHLIARHLASQERMICASPDYLREHGEPASIADIQRHRCVVGTPSGPPTTWHVREGTVEKRVTPPATHQFSDGEAMVDAAVGGLGLVQLPVSLVRENLHLKRLKAVLQAHATTVPVHAVWPRRAQLSPRVRYVIDQLVGAASKGGLA